MSYTQIHSHYNDCRKMLALSSRSLFLADNLRSEDQTFFSDSRPDGVMQDKGEKFESAAGAVMDRLYGTAMRLTKNSANAEDLLAETLLKAWKAIDSLDDFAQFDGWITRILTNTYISEWRRDQKTSQVFEQETCVDDLNDTDSLYAKLHQPFLLWWGSPEKAFVNKLMTKKIEAAIDQLSENFRVVVIIIEVLGYSYDETAELLGVPVGTVRSRLNRGRKQLQQALWLHAKDAGLTGS